MKVALQGQHLRRWLTAQLQGAGRHALAGLCAVRCAEPYRLWTGGINDVTHSEKINGLCPCRAVVYSAYRHGCRDGHREEPRRSDRQAPRDVWHAGAAAEDDPTA